MKKFFVTVLYKKLLNRIFNPFLAMNLKPMLFTLKEDDKCLVIAPHPDDESIGCGGIMKLYPDNFDVLSLTHGDVEDIRYEEMHNAMKSANISNLVMLTMQDKKVLSEKEKFKSVGISDYDYIFIPYIFDQHKDHKATSILLSEKLKTNKYKSNLKIVFYEVWSTINMPQYYVDISSVVEDKKTMINCHKSQIASKDYASKIIGLNSYRGLLKNLDAVESFAILSVDDFQKIVSKMVYDI